MDILANLSTGFATALQPLNLVYCFLGVLLGTLVGVLPGLGPVATIAMLLPATFALPPESALIMLAGIYYGAQYGGSTTAILINLPGESSSIVTALDGYRMAQQGRAGRGAGDCRHRLVLRRHGGDVRDRLPCPALVGGGPEIPGAGVFLADGAGPRRLDRPGAGLAHQGAGHGGAGPAARAWSAPTSPRGRRASPSESPSLPTASTSSSSPWACSASPRSRAISRTSARGRSMSPASAG